MPVNYTIPLREIPFLDNNGIVSLPWYLFLQGLIPGQEEPETAVTVGASPFQYKVQNDGFLIIVGGTVSSVTLLRSGSAHAVQTSGAIPVGKGDILTVTYTVAPAMYEYPL